MSNLNIIDSNVIAIANGLHDNATTECMQNCITFLKSMEGILMNNEDVFLVYDTTFIILNEYYRHCSSGTEKKLGTAFYKWIHRNLNNPKKFKLKELPVNFEIDNDLLPECFEGFDRNDSKYLFLALDFKLHNPCLHYGIDRGYQRYSDCFVAENIELSKLC